MRKDFVVIPFVFVLLMGVLFLTKAIPNPEKKVVQDWALYYAKEEFFSTRDYNEPYFCVINRMISGQEQGHYEVYYVVFTDSEGDYEQYLVSIEYERTEKQIINYKVEEVRK